MILNHVAKHYLEHSSPGLQDSLAYSAPKDGRCFTVAAAAHEEGSDSSFGSESVFCTRLQRGALSVQQPVGHCFGSDRWRELFRTIQRENLGP